MEPTDGSQAASALAPHISRLDVSLVIYRYWGRQAILTRQAVYERAVSIARDYFKISGDITLGTVLEGSPEHYEISPEAWAVMSPSLRIVLVHDAGLPDDGLTDDSESFMLERGRKPVIYLYPPTVMDVSVRLNLIPAWEYSAVYPPTVITKLQLANGQVGQHIEWNVHANPSGLLRDKQSGKDIAYLFWEAETCIASSQSLSTPPSSRANSPALSSHLAESLAFDPTTPQVTPDESILLPAHKVSFYLDDALTVLGLHTEARTSFITYWLPFIMKHPHVALRFLPQEYYEAAAPMEVTPQPDVVTRIFMVARGLDNEEVQGEGWAKASLRASQPVGFWQGIVGMSLEKSLDPTIFRVLEWGGMFVN